MYVLLRLESTAEYNNLLKQIIYPQIDKNINLNSAKLQYILIWAPMKNSHWLNKVI